MLTAYGGLTASGITDPSLPIPSGHSIRLATPGQVVWWLGPRETLIVLDSDSDSTLRSRSPPRYQLLPPKQAQDLKLR